MGVGLILDISLAEAMADNNNTRSDESNPLSVLQSAGTKRGQDSFDGPASKRAHFEGDDSKDLAIKVLIPSAAVGAIIGKGGEAMRNLKNDYQCRVQMSKSSETYPGESLFFFSGKEMSSAGPLFPACAKLKNRGIGDFNSLLSEINFISC
ncbi:KH domain protein [Cooperia oncophora]